MFLITVEKSIPNTLRKDCAFDHNGDSPKDEYIAAISVSAVFPIEVRNLPSFASAITVVDISGLSGRSYKLSYPVTPK